MMEIWNQTGERQQWFSGSINIIIIIWNQTGEQQRWFSGSINIIIIIFGTRPVNNNGGSADQIVIIIYNLESDR
jgi:hypothetical protein